MEEITQLYISQLVLFTFCLGDFSKIIAERETKRYTKFWFENIKGRDHLRNLVVDGKMIIKYMSEKKVFAGRVRFSTDLGSNGEIL
jgi:hypothetical protein